MNDKVKKLTIIGVFSAIAFILMILDFSVPIVPSFLKFDVSDLPELLITFMYGPVSGIVVCLIKCVLHLTVTTSAGVGEFSNFLLGVVLCVSAGLIYQLKRTRTMALISMLCASVLMGLASYLTNYFIIYPFYYNLMSKEAILSICQKILPWIGSIETSIWVFNVPFTIVKGLVCSLVTFLVYKKLKHLLQLDQPAKPGKN
ncbi:MAG: ECF transporter S component [Clostridiales bacterium]|nr:ECF transporter S component [Clostridiales bacterium]